MTEASEVAYFSMEIGLESSIPTYSGGLGILAGDTIRSAADLEVPMVAVTLLYRHGYFRQRLDSRGRQSEEPIRWRVAHRLEPLEPRVTVEVEGRPVQLRAWRYQTRGVTGFQIPVYFLDTYLPENAPRDRKLTDVLYGGDNAYRLGQEAVLGLGGVRMLRALGHRQITCFHLNEGHSALLVLALLEEYLEATGRHTKYSATEKGEQIRCASINAAEDIVPLIAVRSTKLSPEALEAVRAQCVFTTHTPVSAGHDQLPSKLACRILGATYWKWLQACGQKTHLHMTDLALRCSRFVNGVALQHGEISRSMFPDYTIHAITNGVHAPTWVAPSFRRLYDQYVPGWQRDTLLLRYAIDIPDPAIWAAHRQAKRALITYVNRETRAGFDANVLTIGFARRATAYKRATLIFRDLDRLRAIAQQVGPFQLVFAGKAHPRDKAGKAGIRRVHAARKALQGIIPVTYLPNYDIRLGKLLCAGVDVWLNTPLPPQEASGTSGMKAALNGVPSLSVLDGWWVEGHVEDITGWAIGDRHDASLQTLPETDARHAAALHDKLAARVVPCFYQQREHFIAMMRHAITLNGAFFNTQRMVWQYLQHAYRVS